MTEPMRAGECGTSDEQAKIDLVCAWADETVKGWNLPKWPEPATTKYLAKAKAGGTPDPVDALLVLEEWTGAPEGSAARWLAAPAVQAAIARGELLFWPAGSLGVFLNLSFLRVYLEEERNSPEEDAKAMREAAQALEVLPPYIGLRLGLTRSRKERS